MYSPLLLTTFALFGAVVNTPSSPTSSTNDNTAIAPPTTDSPLEAPRRQPDLDRTGPSRTSPLQQRDMQRLRQLNSRYSRQGTSAEVPQFMPQPPTGNLDNSPSQIYQWLPPTVNPMGKMTGNQSTTTRGTMGGVSMIPSSPTRARPDVPQSYASRSAAQSQLRRSDALRDAVAPSNAPGARPYSNYQGNTSSGVSPYMNLYRRDSMSVDNYTTLVRPQLQQQQVNTGVNNDIHGLQSSSRVQGLSLRRLGQETNSLRGVNATQYYMNYGDYYQGSR
jgi:hypothetical protein